MDETTRTKDDATDEPRSLGPYRVIRRLGAGGMGVVYLAHDPKLDRRVAIKVVRADRLESPRAAARFRREARTLAKLRHPSIVQVHEIFEEGDREHVVMELVEGRTLAEVLEAEGALVPEKAIEILAEILEGLVVAHGEGVVHRDLKVENVMLAPNGHVRILDFGLAKWVAATGGDSEETLAEETLAESFVSEEGTVVGTQYAMAPEQARGLPLDGRADLFALGVLAYRLLTGERPFRGATRTDLLARICGERQRPVDELRPEIPPSLARWVDRLLEKSPADRPADARTALEELRRTSPTTDEALFATTLDERASTVVPGVVPDESPQTSSPRGFPARRLARPAVALAVVAIVGLAWLVPSWPTTRPSVVVLEPENTSGRESLDWWGPAVLDLVATNLATTEGLRVLDPTWVEDTRRLLDETARSGSGRLLDTLDVEYAVQGSYVPIGEASQVVDLRLRLVRVDSGEVLWAERTTAEIDSLWTELDEPSAGIRRALAGQEVARGQARALEASFPKSSEATRLYAEGLIRLRELDADGAVERLEEATRLDESSPRTWSALAEAYELQGKDKEAMSAIGKALSFPGSGLSQRERLLIRARGHALAGERDEAVSIYGRLFESEKRADFHLGRRYADALRRAARAEEAESVARELASLPGISNDPRLHLLEAEIAYALGAPRDMLRAAVEAERTAGAWNSAAATRQALLYQSIAFAMMDAADESTRALERLRAAAPASAGDIASLHQLERIANDLKKRGDFAVAEEIYRKILTDARDLGNLQSLTRATIGFSSLLQQRGRFAEALDLLVEANRRVDPLASPSLSAILRFEQATLEMMTGDLDHAASEFSDLIGIFDDQGNGRSTLARANLAEIRFLQGDLDESEVLFEQARLAKLENGQSDAYEMHYLGKIAHRRDHHQVASDWYRRAFESADEGGMLDLRTRVQVDQARLDLDRGDLDEARSRAERALQTAEAGGMDLEAESAREVLARLESTGTSSDG